MTQKPTDSRSYGAGAIGENPNAPVTKTISNKDKWRYRFDNSLFRSPTSFIWWLVIATAVLNGITTLVWVTLQPVEGQGAISGYFTQFFNAFNTIFFGNGPSMATWIDRGFAMACWFISTAITATIIAMATTIIGERMDALKKGKSAILEDNHTLILGWSSRVFPILQQLAISNQNLADPVIVIFADVDRELMDSEINSRVADLGKTRIVTRTGDPSNPRDLARAAVERARAVIILDADETGDAGIVTTVLAVRACAPDAKVKIVAEIDDLEHAGALAHATDGQVIGIQSQNVIARVTAQATRQPGLAAVMLDLLDFEGDEIYFAQVNELTGHTYGEALTGFEKAAIIGIQREDGSLSINPSVDTKIGKGDSVIAIAEDDDRVLFTGFRGDLTNVRAVQAPGERSQAPEHILVIGWSYMGQTILDELAGFVQPGSSVHILANPELVNTKNLEHRRFGELAVQFSEHTGGVEQISAAASARKFNEIIVLGYRDTVSIRESDSHTMMTMLLLNKLFAEEGNGVEPTRLVAEILDSRLSELARVASADDLVVSDNLAALMIAQVSENAALAPVFDDLFDAEGASVNVKPIDLYVAHGSRVTYGEMVAAARSRGESAIGYRIAAQAKTDPSGGVRLNPAKGEIFTATIGDGLIVIGDSNS